MKKILLLLALFCLPLLSYGQSFNKKQLYDLKVHMMLASTNVSLNKIQDWEKTFGFFESKADTIKDAFVKNNKTAILELYRATKFGELDGYKYTEKSSTPIVLPYNGSSVLVVNSLASTSVFNNKNMSKKQIANLVVTEMFLPFCLDVSELKINGAQYLGALIAYESKNFADNYDRGESSCLMCLTSISNLAKLGLCSITDTQFLKECTFLLYDSVGLRKISLE